MENIFLNVARIIAIGILAACSTAQSSDEPADADPPMVAHASKLPTEPSYGAERSWKDLMPEGDLSLWDIYLGPSRETLAELGKSIKDRIDPAYHIGLNPEGQSEFTVVYEKSQPVLKIAGRVYGALITKEQYGNYHLSLRYKWGDKKWPPRLDKPRDSGILFHAFGPYGDRTNSWMKSLEFQVQEGDTGDFWKLGTTMMDAPAALDEDANVYRYTPGAPIVTFGPGNSRCARVENHESPHGDWTRLELYTVGQTSLFVVNGQPVNLLSNTRHIIEREREMPLIRGKIQIQSEAAELYYRDIKIRPLLEIPEPLAALMK